MPRRWPGSRPVSNSVLTVEQLRAENKTLRRAGKKASAADAKLAEWLRDQLAWHKEQLAKATNAATAAEYRAGRLQTRTDWLDGELKRERDHVAGLCSHAHDLRRMHEQVGALEKRVAELQRINEGYEAPGWLPSAAAVPAGRIRAALGRGRD